MKKWRRHLILILLCVCISGLLGCTRTRIVDRISIVHVFGFDQADNGELIGTALVPNYTTSKSGDDIQYYEEKATTSVLFAPKMATQTSTPVELGKIRVLLFGKSYAEAGISEMVKRFILNPLVGTNIQIAVSTESARKTLNIFKQEKSLTLSERLQHNMQGQYLPRMNLHVFLNQFYGAGMDAYVPMVTIDEENRIKVDGIGVFKDDKLKLHLNPEQTTIFSFIEDERTQATYKVDLEDKDRKEIIAVRAFHSKSNWDWNREKEQINLHLQLQVTLTQSPERLSVEKQKDVMEMKRIVEKRIEKGITDLFATLKENGVDPLGIGNIVRSKDSTWKETSFYEKYPELPIFVNVDVQFLHSGLEG
ncbi:Ger(x)C family spore germination protein [Bacillus sp. FJAT-27251]|uniref:Ger(x)C family spore germination protein n=1 Tax=Bacillus sp. FJAT-27251 TaxID=1684142 RepID=UPI0006A78DE0|nr:Ger(x)C family spore germination protein [Bacillus sp. FJAT-27251]